MNEKVTITYQVVVQQTLDPEDYVIPDGQGLDMLGCAQENARSINDGEMGLDEALVPMDCEAVEIKAVSVVAGWA